MTVSIESALAIADVDIDKVESTQGLRFDQERREFLKHLKSVDLRACPGSGKTTSLVAKLAILAEKWPWRHKGLCVLSHTNVAKDEIAKSSEAFPQLKVLGAYPHFLGTIQSFIDQFAGIPGALLAFSHRPKVIDNHQFTTAIYRELLADSRYAKLHTALRAKAKEPKTVADFLSTLMYIDEDLTLSPFPTAKSPWGANTESSVQARALKQVMSQRGVFRYDDMDSLASHFLKHRPRIVEAIAARFPIVFIDEMQDTKSTHALLLQQMVMGSIIQRIGDDRQSIFNEGGKEDDEQSFPGEPKLSFSRSFRLSPKVASLVENLCCCDIPEPLIGNPQRVDGPHSIYLFKRDSIDTVLPRFAQLVADSLGLGLDPLSVRAVGRVAKKNEESKGFPSSLSDYWTEFSPTAKQPQRFRTFGEYLGAAATLLQQTGTAKAGMRLVVDGLCKGLRFHGNSTHSVEFFAPRFLSTLKEHEGLKHKRMRGELAQLCGKLSLPKFTVSEDDLTGVLAILEEVLTTAFNPEARDFFRAFQNSANAAPGTTPNSSSNICTLPTSRGPLRITVGTIHSVKGETVKAILVLDTYYRKQHLPELLSHVLLGQRPSGALNKTLSSHVRHAFVAATRPTDLLCLAMLSEHVRPEHRTRLGEMGWQLVEV